MIFPISGYLIGATAMFCIQYVETADQAIFLACLASAGHDFGQGANWATIVDIGGRYAGTAAGFNNMIGNMGNFIGPQVGAFLFANVSWNAAIAVYAGAFFAAAAMWFFIDPTKKFYKEVDEEPAYPVGPTETKSPLSLVPGHSAEGPGVTKDQ